MQRNLVASLVLCLGVAVAYPANAVDTFWNAGTSGWNIPGNWSTGAVPTGGDAAIIENGGHAQITGGIPAPAYITVGRNGLGTVSYNTGVANSGGTWLDVGQNSTGTFNMNGGSLSFANDIHLGRTGGNGTIVQTAGTLSAQWAGLAEMGPPGNATYNMSGGTLSLAGAGSSFITDRPTLVVGGTGTANLNITGPGAITNSRGINVGANNGSDGTVTQSGAGSSVQGTWIDVGRFGGSTGEYNISNGSLTLNNDIHLGRQGGNGTINQSGGNVSAQWMELTQNDAAGVAVYNLSSGTLTLTDPNAIRNGAGSATFNLTGGVLDLTDGQFHVDNLTFTGGTMRNATDIGIGVAAGVTDLTITGTGVLERSSAGGTTTVNTLFLDGNSNLNVSAGNVQINNQLQVGESGGSSASVTQTGGTVTVNEWINIGHNGQGSYNISGGTLQGNQDINVGDQNGAAALDGQLNVSGAGAVNANGWLFVGKNGSTGEANISSGSITAGRLLVGDTGVGTLNQTGGTVTSTGADDTHVGAAASGTGTYNFSGGTLLTRDLRIGFDGNGTFNQNGGNIALNHGAGNGWLFLGEGNGTGTYNLNAGTLSVGEIHAEGLGQGNFNIDGGTLNLTGVYAEIDQLVVGVNNIGNLTINAGQTYEINNQLQIGDLAGSQGTVTQTGGFVGVDQWINIGHFGQGTYNISGGTLEARHDVNIGDQNGAAAMDGVLSISGTGIVNQTAADPQAVYVGKNGGTGLITIADNGQLNTAGPLQIGEGAGSVGTVTQTGGTVTTNQWINIGHNGQGTYNISGGTLNANHDVNVGDQNGPAAIDGTLIISGTAQVLVNNTTMFVGKNGSTGLVSQTGGDTFANVDIQIGSTAGSTGTYNLDAGTVTAGRAFIVGEAGTGTVNQTDGAVIANQWLQVGRVAGSTGTYNLSGGSATGIQTVNIGESGVGTMTVSNNAQLISGGQIEVSRNNTSAGSSLTLNDNASASANSNVLVGLNNGSNGTLNVNNNASISSGGGTDIRFGNAAGASGTGNISGGTVSAGRAFIVGEAGTGVVNQSGGSVTAANWLQVGRIAGSNGTYNLSGGTATGNDTVNIGESGVGTMTVSNTGALISGGQIEVSRANTSAGSSLTIQDSGSASAATNILIGLAGGSNGTVNVQGGTLDAATNLVVGQSGTGLLDVSGGVVTTGDLIVAQNGGSTGTVNQTGGVINVLNPTTHTVADGGAGTVNHSGGVTNVVGNMNIGTSSGTGVYNLSDTGELDFLDTSGPSPTFFPAAPATQVTTGLDPSTLTVGLNGTFNFDGGTLRNVTTIDVTSATGVSFDQDGGRFVIGVDGVDPNDAATIRAITTITGDFNQSDGTLVVDIFGPNAHGGNGEAASTIALDVADPMLDLDSDLLHVMGNADLDGTLEINLNGFTPGPFHWYDVLLADGTIDDSGLTVNGVNLFRVIDNPFGPGQLLQVAVPEPASIALWSLLGLASAAFGWYRRRLVK